MKKPTLKIQPVHVESSLFLSFQLATHRQKVVRELTCPRKDFLFFFYVCAQKYTKQVVCSIYESFAENLDRNVAKKAQPTLAQEKEIETKKTDTEKKS